jgi:hypothetical protein
MADCTRCGAKAGIGKNLCRECTPVVEAELQAEQAEKERQDREFQVLRRKENEENKERLEKERRERQLLDVQRRQQAEEDRKARYQEFIDQRLAHLRTLIDAGVTPYLYEEITVESQSYFVDQAKVGFWDPKVQQRTNTIGSATNIEYLQLMGIRGWEIVASIPITYGAVLTNHTGPAGQDLAYAGGYGGMVVGARLILRLPITAGTLEDSRDTIIALLAKEYRD